MQRISWPERLVDLKRQIVEATPDYEKRLTECWKDILQELEKRTTDIAQAGSDVSPTAVSVLDFVQPNYVHSISPK